MCVSELADEVLPLIRTKRSDLYRWGASNEHGAQMREGVEILREAFGVDDPKDVYDVTHRALASAIKVIAKADDSSGIIGDACRSLLELHPVAAAAAGVPAKKLVDWMMKFQFDGEVDYFELDPVAYAPALGETGLSLYRKALDERAATVAKTPDRTFRSHAEFVLEWNGQRLAVLDRDINRIIETHLRGGKVAAHYKNVAEALAEIGEYDLAIEWAKKAMDFGDGHQSEDAGEYWADLTAQQYPGSEIKARLEVFERWPKIRSAAKAHRAAGVEWPLYRDQILSGLTASPRDAVMFIYNFLEDVPLAWKTAMDLKLSPAREWLDLVYAYEKIDPLATILVQQQIVEGLLERTHTPNYRPAAERMAKMRRFANGTALENDVEAFIAEVKAKYRNRPRLTEELKRAKLY